MPSRAERDRIAQAIRAAESRTSAEIVVLVAARAGAYRSVAVFAALAFALALPWPLILSTGWSASRIALAQAILVLAVLVATSIPRLRLAIVPRSLQRARAHEAALREFVARGVTGTRGRTGILVYVALAERYAEIVADTAVAARVPRETWSAAIDDLLAALRRGRTAEGLIDAVDKAGSILAVELPGGPDDADELPNRVILTG